MHGGGGRGGAHYVKLWLVERWFYCCRRPIIHSSQCFHPRLSTIRTVGLCHFSTSLPGYPSYLIRSYCGLQASGEDELSRRQLCRTGGKQRLWCVTYFFSSSKVSILYPFESASDFSITSPLNAYSLCHAMYYVLKVMSTSQWFFLCLCFQYSVASSARPTRGEWKQTIG